VKGQMNREPVHTRFRRRTANKARLHVNRDHSEGLSPLSTARDAPWFA